MRLTMLGTQGWIPTQRRETTSLAVLDGDRLLIFDAGTGLGRLVEAPASALLRQAAESHLFLTHYHLDHVCGLAYLPGLFADTTLHIHVPEPSINGVDVERGIGELIRHPYNPGKLELPGLTVDALREGINEVAGHQVHVRQQCHPDTTVAYRVDDAFVLATDTVSDPETAEFARGVRLLLHESWIDGVEEEQAGKEELVARAYKAHTSARQAARIAAEAGVDELFLIHLNPLMDEAYYQQEQTSAREIFPGTSIVPDLYWRDL